MTWTDANGLFNDEVITISLDPDSAPVHVENLHLHAVEGNYDNTQFHRVIDGFMIQGGDFERGDGTGGYAAKWYGYCNGEAMDNFADCTGGETLYTMPDEADNGLIHTPCTISMAKTSAPHTGGSQFFLIPEDSTPNWLDGQHTVFGDITDGCEFVTSISEIDTGANDVPVNPVTMVSVTTNGGEDTPWWYFW
jgi:peptidyl-prolyl cis-trans isomerase B (cyclophilin B)